MSTLAIEPCILQDSSNSTCKARGLSEDRLLEAAKRGHSTAFGTLCERYAQQLFRAAHRITRNREDAEDAVQDTLLRAFVHLKDFDGRSSFATWLTRIAINSALMILRKKRGSLEVAIEGSDDSGKDRPYYQIPDRTPNPERRYAQREEETILNRAVESLRPALREAVKIQRLQERSMHETAKTMGISVAAAKGRLYHARVALRKSSVLRLLQQPRSRNEIRVLSAA